MAKNHLNQKVQAEIDHNLRRAFEDIARDPVPDRFIELLAILRMAEESNRNSAPTEGGEDE